MNISLSSLESRLLGLLAGMTLFAGVTASADTLAYYRFDGTEGEAAASAFDSSSNAYHMTVVDGVPRYSNDVPPLTGELNGSSIELIPQSAFLGIVDEDLSNAVVDDFTVETWVNFTNPAGWQTMVSRTDSAGDGHNSRPQALFILLNSGIDNRFWAEVSTVEGTTLQISAGPVVVPGRWYHVAAVGDVDAGTMKLFVNGDEVASIDGYTGMLRPATGMPWSIGRTTFAGNPSDWTHGKIDEVRISNAVLHPSEFLVEATFHEHPEDVIAHVGTPAVFTANFISNAPVPPILQWEVSADDGATWTPIAGANSESYTIAAASLAENRNQYRLKATTADEAVVISEAALLRVGDGVAPPPANVVAHYSFEEGTLNGSVTAGQDSSGNGYTLANRGGAPVYSDLVPQNPISQTGAPNLLSLDVTADRSWIGGTRNDALSQVIWTDITVEAWVRFTNMDAWQQIVSRDDLDDQNFVNEALFRVDKTAGNTLRVVVYNTSGEGLFLDTPYGFEMETWTHIAVVGDATAGTLSAYANGKLVGSMTGYDGLLASESPWVIGRGQWGADEGDFLNGQIDEVRFSSAALTPVEFLNFSYSILQMVTHPSDFADHEGREAVFHALAGGGSGELTYQWQVLAPGSETWTDIEGATDETYTIAAISADQDGNQYRAVASRGGDSVSSEPATLTVLDPVFELLTHPEDLIVWSGQPASFSAAVRSSIPTIFQWEVSTDGGASWAPIGGAASSTHTIASTPLAADRNQYRLVATGVLTGETITLTTDAALLRVGDSTTTPPPVEGVVAYYRFEGADGADATGTDSSGNGYDLNARLAFPRYSASVPQSGVPHSGAANNSSLSLRSGNSAIQGVDNDALAHVDWDDFTIEAWVKFDRVGAFQQIVGRDDRGNQNNDDHSLFRIECADDSRFRAVATIRDGSLLFLNSNYFFTPDVWNHVAIVGDSAAGTLSLYHDGQLVARVNGFTGLFIPHNPKPHWTIGRGQHIEGMFDFVDGLIDEVRFTSMPLKPNQFLNFTQAILNFAEHPANLTVAAGQTATFSALADGGGQDQLTYQWQVSHDDGETWMDIPLADQATYTKGSVTIGDDENQYRVLATRGGETVSSNAATLTVTPYPAPVIVQGLGAGKLAFPGQEVSLSVEANGIGALTYQWQLNGVDIDGETNATLDLGVVDASADGNSYSVVITDRGALQEELEPTTVTLSTVLTIVPPPVSAISLNFVGAGDGLPNPFSSEPGLLNPEEVAGAIPVTHWNNTPTGRVATSEAPLPLVDDLGEPTNATATWIANNTWGGRFARGAVGEKDANQRLYHGYIESRSDSAVIANPTVTITGIDYDTYDVYVYPVGVEGASGQFIRSITLTDANETATTLYGRNFGGNNNMAPIPFHLATATSQAEAEAASTATVFRFPGVTGSSITITHADVAGFNAGGIAGISIVNTSAGDPARPIFTAWPSGRFVPAGTPVSLSVSARSASGGSLSYAWDRDGTPVGGNTPTLAVDTASSANSGRYTVTVTDTATGAINRATAPVVIVDSTAYALISTDVGPSLTMQGNGSLRADGSLFVVEGTDDIAQGATQWVRLAEGLLEPTYRNLTDAAGLPLPEVSVRIVGATGEHDAVVGGGMEGDPEQFSNPLLSDYLYSTNQNSIRVTVAGLKAFAGRDARLVVYALGRDGKEWPMGPGLPTATRNDVATVTLAAQNDPDGIARSGVTDMGDGQVGGRDLYYNDKAYVAFDAVVAPNGTISWEIGAVPGEPGLNPFNGFQLLIKDTGDGPVHTALESWLLDHFGTVDPSGAAAFEADPDGDGISNLLEYALGTDPTLAGDGRNAVISGEAGGFLTLTFQHIDDPSLIYEIEATSDLAAGWTVVERYDDPPFTTVGETTFTDFLSIQESARRFLRLQVSIEE